MADNAGNAQPRVQPQQGGVRGVHPQPARRHRQHYGSQRGREHGHDVPLDEQGLPSIDRQGLTFLPTRSCLGSGIAERRVDSGVRDRAGQEPAHEREERYVGAQPKAELSGKGRYCVGGNGGGIDQQHRGRARFSRVEEPTRSDLDRSDGRPLTEQAAERRPRGSRPQSRLAHWSRSRLAGRWRRGSRPRARHIQEAGSEVGEDYECRVLSVAPHGLFSLGQRRCAEMQRPRHFGAAQRARVELPIQDQGAGIRPSLLGLGSRVRRAGLEGGRAGRKPPDVELGHDR
jgi:hypothetical protein